MELERLALSLRSRHMWIVTRAVLVHLSQAHRLSLAALTHFLALFFLPSVEFRQHARLIGVHLVAMLKYVRLARTFCTSQRVCRRFSEVLTTTPPSSDLPDALQCVTTVVKNSGGKRWKGGKQHHPEKGRGQPMHKKGSYRKGRWKRSTLTQRRKSKAAAPTWREGQCAPPTRGGEGRQHHPKEGGSGQKHHHSKEGKGEEQQHPKGGEGPPLYFCNTPIIVSRSFFFMFLSCLLNCFPFSCCHFFMFDVPMCLWSNPQKH